MSTAMSHGTTTGTKPFERLVGLIRDNDRLQIELTGLRLHIDGVRIYLGRPDCNKAMGEARLERLRGEYLALARELRDRRREVRALMSEAACWPEPDADVQPVRIPAAPAALRHPEHPMSA